MMNKTLILFILSSLFLVFNLEAKEYDIVDYLNPDNSDRKAYIQKYKDIAMAEMARAGIPASIKLAQGILESGDGKSTLANEANNHFGMKCGTAWEGNTFYLRDDDYNSDGQLIKSCFRVFETPQQSYYAHSEFLHNPKKAGRYGYLFDLDVRDYRAWAKGLKAAGYATNPRYPQLLIGIIEANKLYEYDLISLFELDLVESSKPTKPVVTDTGKPLNPSNYSKNEVVLNNGVRMIFAQAGDSPSSIENLFGVKAKKVTIYNELYEGGSLRFKEGDRIYLQSKRKKWRGKTEYHTVKTGETMYAISQQYGLRTTCLYKRNRMVKGTQPAKGQKIALRKKIKRNRSVKLRDPNKDPIPTPAEQPVAQVELDPKYDLSNGQNIVDVVRTNVNAFDMRERTDAYLKITSGTPVTTQPYTPPTPPRPTPTNPTYPPHTEPEVVTPNYPTYPTNPQPTSPEVITPSTPSPSAPPVSNGQYHIIESGDTLYAVSKRYGVSVSEIKRLNGLSSNVISIGQRLRIR